MTGIEIETADVMGHPVALVTPHDLFSILEGRALSVGTLDGRSIAIRLYTPEEFFKAHVDACEKFGIPTTMSASKAEELTRPIKLFREEF